MIAGGGPAPVVVAALDDPKVAPAVDDQAALVLDGVSMSYGGILALRDVTIAVPRGAVAAVVGPNGAGKTTLLNAISGVHRGVASGRVLAHGHSLLDGSPLDVVRRGVGRSFQDPPLLEQETVLDNIVVGLHLRLGYNAFDQLFHTRRYRRAESEARAAAGRVIDAFGLGAVAHTAASDLSYGQRKLVDIARAVVAEPGILLLDEPTSGLDLEERARVEELLLQIRAEGDMTTVLIEHNMAIVRTVATWMIGLQAGAVIANGPTDDVLRSSSMRDALIGRSPDEPDDPGEEEQP